MANIHNDSKDKIQWPVVIMNQQERSSLDFYYGPYESLSDLDNPEVLPVNLKTVGFTVAVVDEDKKHPVEYWWTGSGWERKTVDVSSVVRLKGIVESETALNKLTGQSNGDMYLVPSGSEYQEFVWVADKGKWELLGLRSASLNQGLTISNAAGAMTVGSKTKQSNGTYNGSQDVTLDMSKFVTTADAASYATMSKVKEEMADLYVPLSKVRTWSFCNSTSNKAYFGNKFATVKLAAAGQRATLIIAGKEFWNSNDAGATWVFQVSQNYTASDGQIIGAVGVQLHGTATKNGGDCGTSQAATITQSKCYLLAKWTDKSTYDLYWIVPGGASYYHFCATFICAGGYDVTPCSGENGVLTSSSAIPTVDGESKGVLRPRILNLATTSDLSNYVTATDLADKIKELQDQITTLQTTVGSMPTTNGMKTYMEGKLKQLEGIVIRNSNGVLTTVTGYKDAQFDDLTTTSLNVTVSTDGEVTASTINGTTLNLTGYGYSSGK